MKYRVHRLDVKSDNMQEKLEQFLNKLDGEVISVIPNYAKTTLFQIYGITSKIDFILILEKVK
jgi:hypothetical protein